RGETVLEGQGGRERPSGQIGRQTLDVWAGATVPNFFAAGGLEVDSIACGPDISARPRRTGRNARATSRKPCEAACGEMRYPRSGGGPKPILNPAFLQTSITLTM